MLIFCEQMERAYNSDYFIYFEITELTPKYLANNPDKYESPYAIVAYSETDDSTYIFGSYSSKDIANDVFVDFLEQLTDDSISIVNISTEEHFLSFENRKFFK